MKEKGRGRRDFSVFGASQGTLGVTDALCSSGAALSAGDLEAPVFQSWTGPSLFVRAGGKGEKGAYERFAPTEEPSLLLRNAEREQCFFEGTFGEVSRNSERGMDSSRGASSRNGTVGGSHDKELTRILGGMMVGRDLPSLLPNGRLPLASAVPQILCNNSDGRGTPHSSSQVHSSREGTSEGNRTSGQGLQSSSVLPLVSSGGRKGLVVSQDGSRIRERRLLTQNECGSAEIEGQEERDRVFGSFEFTSTCNGTQGEGVNDEEGGLQICGRKVDRALRRPPSHPRFPQIHTALPSPPRHSQVKQKQGHPGEFSGCRLRRKETASVSSPVEANGRKGREMRRKGAENLSLTSSTTVECLREDETDRDSEGHKKDEEDPSLPQKLQIAVSMEGDAEAILVSPNAADQMPETDKEREKTGGGARLRSLPRTGDKAEKGRKKKEKNQKKGGNVDKNDHANASQDNNTLQTGKRGRSRSSTSHHTVPTKTPEASTTTTAATPSGEGKEPSRGRPRKKEGGRGKTISSSPVPASNVKTQDPRTSNDSSVPPGNPKRQSGKETAEGGEKDKHKEDAQQASTKRHQRKRSVVPRASSRDKKPQRPLSASPPPRRLHRSASSLPPSPSPLPVSEEHSNPTDTLSDTSPKQKQPTPSPSTETKTKPQQKETSSLVIRGQPAPTAPPPPSPSHAGPPPSGGSAKGFKGGRRAKSEGPQKRTRRKDPELLLLNRQHCLQLLRYLQNSVAKPVCRHFKIRFAFLYEQPATATKAGVTVKKPLVVKKEAEDGTIEVTEVKQMSVIRIRMRRKKDPMEFVNVNTQCAVLFHELAHLRHMNHGINFAFFLRDIFLFASQKKIFNPSEGENEFPSAWAWERLVFERGGAVSDAEIRENFFRDRDHAVRATSAAHKNAAEAGDVTEQIECTDTGPIGGLEEVLVETETAQKKRAGDRPAPLVPDGPSPSALSSPSKEGQRLEEIDDEEEKEKGLENGTDARPASTSAAQTPSAKTAPQPPDNPDMSPSSITPVDSLHLIGPNECTPTPLDATPNKASWPFPEDTLSLPPRSPETIKKETPRMSPLERLEPLSLSDFDHDSETPLPMSPQSQAPLTLPPENLEARECSASPLPVPPPSSLPTSTSTVETVLHDPAAELPTGIHVCRLNDNAANGETLPGWDALSAQSLNPAEIVEVDGVFGEAD